MIYCSHSFTNYSLLLCITAVIIFPCVKYKCIIICTCFYLNCADYGWFLPVPGSVFNWQVFFSIIGTTSLSTLLALLSCSYHPTWNSCFPLPIGWNNLTLVAVSAFVLIIFTTQLINRWWEIRLLIQGVFGKGNSIIITLASILSVTLSGVDEETERDARRCQQQIYRYLNAAHATMYKVNYSDYDLTEIEERGLLTSTEVQYLHSMQPFSTTNVYSWVAILIQRLGAAGLLGDMLGEGAVNMKLLLQDLETIRANNSMVTVYIKTQLPYAFVQVVAVVVYALLIQATLVTAGYVGLGLAQSDGSLIFNGYFTLILLCFVFQGLMSTYRLLSDPLGDDAADFPTKRLVKDLVDRPL